MTTSPALSYVHGAYHEPLLGETIGHNLDRTAQRFPDNPALIVRSQGIRWSYRELVERAEAFAAGLLALGLERGDRIGIWSLNNAEWVTTQFATAKAGLILVNINPSYRLTELEYALNKVACKALILATRFKTSDYIGLLTQLAPELPACRPGALDSARLPHLRTVIQIGGSSPGTYAFDDVAGLATDWHRAELARLQPAAAVRRHHQHPVHQRDHRQPERRLADPPQHPQQRLLHRRGDAADRAGQALHPGPALPLLRHGARQPRLHHAWHARWSIPARGSTRWPRLQAVAEERCTGLHGVPTMFIAELEHPEFDRFDLSSLRTGIMAGSPCPIEVMRRAVSRMHLREITIAYGMTETSPVSFQSSTDDPIERRVSTVGRIHPHLEVKIVDAEGRIVPRGVPGELCTRGYSVMPGYWDDEEKTRTVIDPARWMHTGDLATIDAEGFCNIVGRIKDLVIRGGENVYPREIEEFLYTHPAIQDVQVFGVAGRPLWRGGLRLDQAAAGREPDRGGGPAPIAAVRSRIRRSRATSASSMNFR